MKLSVVLLIIITINSKNIFFKSDYFYQRNDDGDNNQLSYYNETAQSSLVKCLTSIFVFAPITLYFGGPLITLTPISVGILNAYIYHGSIKSMETSLGGGGKKKKRKNNKSKKKKKVRNFNYDAFYKSKHKLFDQVKGIIIQHRKISKILQTISIINFFLIFLSILYRNKYWISFFLILFISFSFISTFYLTFKNEMNKIELDKLYMFDEYVFECLSDKKTSNYESFIESFNANFRIAVGLNKGNYETIEGVKLNSKCLALLKKINKIDITIFQVFTQMIVDLFTVIWVKLFERFSKIQLIVMGSVLGVLGYVFNPVILNVTLTALFNKR